MATEPSTRQASGHSYSHLEVGGSSRAMFGDMITNHNYSATPWQPPSHCFLVPFARNDTFTGREEILEKVRNRFRTYHSVAITGIGGIGKSQIAIQYCYDFQAENPESYVVWIYCGNPERIKQDYVDIARTMKLPGWDDPSSDKLQIVYDWFCHGAGKKWLIILDNCDDSEFIFRPDSQLDTPLLRYLPKSDNGRILITSRDRRVAIRLTQSPLCVYTVEPFSAKEAESLLTKKLKKESENESENDSDTVESLRTIVKELDYIPLAITQAAAYIEELCISVSDYLSMMRERDLELEALQFDQMDITREFREGSSNAIFKTWMISFEQIQSKEPRAFELLLLMAMLDRQGIPKTILRADFSNEPELNKALAPLLNFSFVVRKPDNKEFSMHRLIQLFVKKWIEDDGILHNWQERAVVILEKGLPLITHENAVECRHLLPTVHAVLDFGLNAVETARLLSRIAQYTMFFGDFRKSKRLCVASAQMYEKLFGIDHHRTRSSLLEFANTSMALTFDYNEAFDIYVNLLNSCRHDPDVLQEDVIGLQAKLAECQYNRGSKSIAIQSLRHLLFWYTENLGPDCEDTIRATSNLAFYLKMEGQLLESEELYKQIYEESFKLYGPDVPDTLSSGIYWSMALAELGRYDDAESMAREILGKSEKRFGSRSLMTFRSRSQLAKIVYDQGQLTTSETLFRELMFDCDQVLGPNHFITRGNLLCLARILSDLQRFQESDLCYRDLIIRNENYFGSDDKGLILLKREYALQYQRLLGEGVKDADIPEGFKIAAIQYADLLELEIGSEEDSSDEDSSDECHSEGILASEELSGENSSSTTKRRSSI